MDLCNLERDIREVENADIEFFHFDVVDGQFNQCIILGSPTLVAMREKTLLPIEVHIAAYKPELFIERFIKEGADYIAVHYEAMEKPRQIFDLISSFGATPILAFRAETAPGKDFIELATQVPWVLKLMVNPGFSGQKMQPIALDHIKMMREEIINAGIDTHIQADGNMHISTIPYAVKAGADMFTGGTSGMFFGPKSIYENARDLLSCCHASGTL